MSTSKQPKKLVPGQQKGAKSDTSDSVSMQSPEEAIALFSVAKNRLLDISHWDKLCGPVTGTFYLTDNLGNRVDRLAKPGDHLKIDVPGPGTKTGDGYDWVKIEAIEESSPVDGHEELAMRVRPAQNPNNNDADTAHFFQNDATSTFIVKREKNIVTAEVHGRNELANINQQHPLDSIRNTLMALSAMLGFSSGQWKQLVKGLISREKLR